MLFFADFFDIPWLVWFIAGIAVIGAFVGFAMLETRRQILDFGDGDETNEEVHDEKV